MPLELGRLITKKHIETRTDGEVTYELYEVYGELAPGSLYYKQCKEAVLEADASPFASEEVRLWAEAFRLGLPLWVKSGTIIREGLECNAKFTLEEVSRMWLERQKELLFCPPHAYISALFGTEFGT